MILDRLFKNKEFSNASWLIGGRVAQMILSLFVGILTARYLGPAGYGLISYGGAYVSFFSALCTLGINSVIIKDFVDNPKETGEAIGSSLLLRFISSLLSVFMIVGIVSIADNGEKTTVIVVALCSMGSIFHIFEIINFWFQYQYKSKITAIATLSAYITTSVYKIILLILDKSVYWFAFATSVDYIVVAVILLYAYHRYGGSKFSFSLQKSKTLLNSSRHYILSSIAVSVYGHTDKLMLKQMLGENDVGYYATATAVCAMWTFILPPIIDSMYPTILRLKNQNYADYEKKNRQLYAIVFYVSCFVSVLFLLFGNYVIGLLYGEDYLPAVPVLKTVTWYTAFSFLGVARNAWIVSEGQQKYLKYIYGCAAVLNVILNFVLIPVLGATGAALATLITQMLTSVFLPLCINKLRPNAKLMLEAIALRNLR